MWLHRDVPNLKPNTHTEHYILPKQLPFPGATGIWCVLEWEGEQQLVPEKGVLLQEEDEDLRKTALSLAMTDT